MKKGISMFLASLLLTSAFSYALAETPVTPITTLDTETYTVDPTNPLTSQYFGLYSIELPLESGTVRTIYQYVPESWKYRQPEVAVAVPSGEDPVEFFEKTGWKAASEKGSFAVVLMTAGEGGWAADESEYAYATFDYMDKRTYLQTQDSAFYMVGYGDAANAVMQHAVTNSELFAGFAALGVDHFDTAILEQGRTEESGAAGIMKSEVAVPMWIACDEKTDAVNELIDYWKSANECSDDFVSNSYADEIYSFPEYMATTYEKTYAHVSKLYVTVGTEDIYSEDFTNNLWGNFLRRVRRQDSGDINALRYFASNDELGMDYETMEVDGVTREFYVYVPSTVKEGKKTNVPVVFVCHGGGGSAEEFPSRSGWTKTAEERNFIAVYMTGARSGKFKAGTTWSGADVPFFKQVREYVLSHYSADSTRLYVTGHSQGSVMTYNIAYQCPELIAAACGNDGIVYQEKIENKVMDIVMPFMLNIGDKDKHFVEGGGNYGQVPDIVAEWGERYEISTDEETARKFSNGANYGYDYVNDQGYVVIREQWNEGKVHAMVPDDTYTVYDFLCNYSRGEDGTSYFMGKEIKLK